MIRNVFRRHKLAIILAALLALNAMRYWHGKHLSETFHRAPTRPRPSEELANANSFPELDPGMRQRIEGALQGLSDEQRKAVEDRMTADRAFFESVQDLPEEQRREKMAEHLEQNAPLPGFDPGSTGPPGGGDARNGDLIHLPPPDIRRSMDQQIANSRKEPAAR
jgi:hypothetical protein